MCIRLQDESVNAFRKMMGHMTQIDTPCGQTVEFLVLNLAVHVQTTRRERVDLCHFEEHTLHNLQPYRQSVVHL